LERAGSSKLTRPTAEPAAHPAPFLPSISAAMLRSPLSRAPQGPRRGNIARLSRERRSHPRSPFPAPTLHRNDRPIPCSAAAAPDPTSSSVMSHAQVYNHLLGSSGDLPKAARPRLTLRMMSWADFVQIKGLGWALLCAM